MRLFSTHRCCHSLSSAHRPQRHRQSTVRTLIHSTPQAAVLGSPRSSPQRKGNKLNEEDLQRQIAEIER